MRAKATKIKIIHTLPKAETMEKTDEKSEERGRKNGRTTSAAGDVKREFCEFY